MWEREHHLFRSCDALSTVLCFCPSDLLGTCQNSLFCDLMFLSSQFTVIIWLTAFSTKVHASWQQDYIIFVPQGFCQSWTIANIYSFILNKIYERKEGRREDKWEGSSLSFAQYIHILCPFDSNLLDSITPILQIRKLELRKDKWFFHGQTASKYRSDNQTRLLFLS